MNRYSLLDPFRLFLAVAVVFGHWNRSIQPFPAVPAFLALSGFLVLQSYEGSRNWQHFAWKRFVRVMPALLVVFVAAFFIVGYERGLGVIAYYFRFGFARMSADGSLWSLPFEEALYASLVVMYLCGAYRSRVLVWVLAGVGLAICLYGSFFTPPKEAVENLPRTFPLIYCFFVGNLIYLHKSKLFQYRYGGFALLAIALGFELYGNIVHDLPHALCRAAIFAAPGLLLVGTQFKPKMPRFPDFSYSLYIWHALLFTWCRITLHSNWIAVALLPPVCVASWYLVEKPCLTWKDRPWQLPKKSPRAELIEVAA
jgi:peptidoglycan/LPS O-acetylase OafA/YrhL